MSLAATKAAIKQRAAAHAKTLWAGPNGAGPNGGITQGLIGKFLVCRERCRVWCVEGLKSVSQFRHRLEYGNMWHVCEEALATVHDRWEPRLLAYAQELARKYQFQQEEIDKWYRVCKAQFPIYVDYWAKHPDVVNRTPLFQEQSFDVPYQLPSGRTVRLRGKWDAVDLIKEGKASAVYLQENKTVSEIDEEKQKRKLTFDLQTGLYGVTLVEHLKDPTGLGVPGRKFGGVRYNVVRRPLSGGKGSIVRHAATKGAKCGKCKGTGRVFLVSDGGIASGCPKCNGAGRTGAKLEETKDAFYERVAKYIRDEPETYFARWKVDFSPGDLDRFRQRCLDPILENMCDWWEQVSKQNCGPVAGNYRTPMNWQHPHGIFNPIDNGGETEIDEYMRTGSLTGLERRTVMFEELS